MFDTIKNELYCPYCGCKQKTNDFQTKDFKKCMNSLDILEIRGVDYVIYTTCFNCNNWIELQINNCNGVHNLKEGEKQIKKKKKEIANLFKPYNKHNVKSKG